MLKIRRRLWIFGLSGAVALATVFAGASASTAASPSDWALSSSQVAQARQALMLVATGADPTTPAAQPRVAGAWPSNLTAAIAFGTDRGAANAAMGEPKAVAIGNTQQVVCAQGKGEFSTANIPHPPGSPLQTYTYAVICFDPSTGKVTDTGYDNKPLTGSFSSTQKIDLTAPITSVTQ